MFCLFDGMLKKVPRKIIAYEKSRPTARFYKKMLWAFVMTTQSCNKYSGWSPCPSLQPLSTGTPKQRFLPRGPRTGSSGIGWELVRNANACSSPQTYLIINCEGGASRTLNKLFGGFRVWKCEDRCSNKAMVITVRSKTNMCIWEVIFQFSKSQWPHLQEGYSNIHPAQFGERLIETGKSAWQTESKLNFPFLSLEKTGSFSTWAFSIRSHPFSSSLPAFPVHLMDLPGLFIQKTDAAALSEI